MNLESKDPHSKTTERKEALLRACLAKAKEQRQKNISRWRILGGTVQPTCRSKLLLASLHPQNSTLAEEQQHLHAEGDWSEEDEILALLGGDRDLYLSLMTDLEDALQKDLMAEEEVAAREQQIWELECWEEQLSADVEGELYQRQKRQQQVHELEFTGSEMEQEQEDCMQVLVNENSCSSGSYLGEKKEAVGLEVQLHSDGECDIGPDGEVDYLVCPVCKRQCMELRIRSMLAECRCGARCV